MFSNVDVEAIFGVFATLAAGGFAVFKYLHGQKRNQPSLRVVWEGGWLDVCVTAGECEAVLEKINVLFTR